MPDTYLLTMSAEHIAKLSSSSTYIGRAHATSDCHNGTALVMNAAKVTFRRDYRLFRPHYSMHVLKVACCSHYTWARVPRETSILHVNGRQRE
jgi:hypothetical protein